MGKCSLFRIKCVYASVFASIFDLYITVVECLLLCFFFFVFFIFVLSKCALILLYLQK